MDVEPKYVRRTYDFNHLVANVWIDDDLGLQKDCIAYRFITIEKPSEVSKCFVCISDVQHLGDRESVYLRRGGGDNDDEQQQGFWIEIGSAETPVDRCVEEFLQQMLGGEKSRCSIRTKGGGNRIAFTIEMGDIDFGGYLYELTPTAMYAYAKRLKDNGVKMFKKWPKFAQHNFNRAFKCLHTLMPFERSPDEATNEFISGDDLQQLYDNTLSNIAACLLLDNRYEDVLDALTELNDKHEVRVEKAVYRRATAHYHLKQYEEAKVQIERLDYRGTREFAVLHEKIMAEWKKYNEQYASMVKKMFG